jgi:Protein of unknown function (DUF2569)
MAMYGELVLNLLFIAIIFYTTHCLFAEKRIFKKAFTIQALSVLLIPILDWIWGSAVSGIPLASMLDVMAEPVGRGIGAAIGCSPWIAYVWCSRRVKNTFVR